MKINYVFLASDSSPKPIPASISNSQATVCSFSLAEVDRKSGLRFGAGSLPTACQIRRRNQFKTLQACFLSQQPANLCISPFTYSHTAYLK